MNLNCLLTASIDQFYPGMKGATLANYCEFQEFIKDKNGKIIGARVKDRMTDKEFKV